MVVYELYKLQNGAIDTKLNLTVDKIFLVPDKGAVKAHYVVDFKEKLIENIKGHSTDSMWVFPNPVKSGSQNYEAAERIADAELLYYFVSYLDKELEFTINYKESNYYSVVVDENVLGIIKQEKNKWDQVGYTDSKDKSLLNLRKNKALVDKGIHKIDAGIFNSFLAAAKKEGVNVPDKLAENDFKLFREIYGRKLKKPVAEGTIPKVEDYYTGEEIYQIWKNGWNEETLSSSPIVQTGENTGKVKQPGGGSGTGATLTPLQQKKIEYFGVMASYLDRDKGGWKKFVDDWKIKNAPYVERTQAAMEQPLK